MSIESKVVCYTVVLSKVNDARIRRDVPMVGSVDGSLEEGTT